MTPLLRTGAKNSGLLNWSDLVRNDPFFGISLQPNPLRINDEYAHVIAAQIQTTEEASEDAGAPKVNAIFVADVDLVSDDVFNIAERQLFDLKIDNIKFVLNCVDMLAGEKEFITLRKQRDQARTLKLVEDLTTNAVEKRTKAVQVAQEKADEELQRVQDELAERVKQIENNTQLDDRSKQRQISMEQMAQEKRLEVFEQEINRETEAEIKTIKADSEREINAVKGQIRFWAIVLPPLPAILLGLAIGISRSMKERNTIAQERRLP